MGTILIWIVFGAVGTVAVALLLEILDRLLLRAEEKGWIYYRKKSGSGTISSGIGGAMTELDRLARPSAEYRIQAEIPVVEEDEQDGE